MILTSRSEKTGPMDCGVMRMNCLPQASLAAEIYVFKGDQQMVYDIGRGEMVWSKDGGGGFFLTIIFMLTSRLTLSIKTSLKIGYELKVSSVH